MTPFEYGYTARHGGGNGPGVDSMCYDARHADPDQQLVERIAFALYRFAGGEDTPYMSSASDREHYLPAARMVIDAVREVAA